MTNIAGFPYREVQFNKRGDIHDHAEVQALLAMITDEAITDLIAISHGWNNDMGEARALYRAFFGSLQDIVDNGSTGGLSIRRLGIMGVFWPSKKFNEVELLPGGAASLDAGLETFLIEQLQMLPDAFDAEDAEVKMARAIELVPDLEDRRTARDEFGEILKDLLGDRSALDDEGRDEIPQAFFDLSGNEMMEKLSAPLIIAPSGDRDTEGGAAFLGDIVQGIGNATSGTLAGAIRLLNLTTYWQMKKRAGTVGAGGVYDVLQQVQSQHPMLKIHLIGHSFGGRLVTSAAQGPDDQPGLRIASMSLLQAAFSHNGFAENFDRERDGYFRRVVIDHRVLGPILITHTANDRAVGLAYPLASRLSGDDAAGIGGRDDPYGGIGVNGALHTPESEDITLLGDNGNYVFQAGTLYNLLADDFISSHSDITGKEVANAIARAIAVT